MLTTTRKADRLIMAKRFCEIAQNLGIENRYKEHGRAVHLSAGINKVSVGLTLYGERNLRDTFIMHWNSKDRFSFKFSWETNSQLNRYHGCKATGVAYNFDATLLFIKRGLELARENQACSAE